MRGWFAVGGLGWPVGSVIQARFLNGERPWAVVAVAHPAGSDADVNDVGVFSALPAVGELLEVGAQAAGVVSADQDVG